MESVKKTIRKYSKQDTARVIKAQSYQNGYYPRSWLPLAFNAGFSVNDICWLIASDCKSLGKIASDVEVDDVLRVCCRDEQYDRRRYQLPASGLPYVDEKQESRDGKAIIFGQDNGASGGTVGFYDLLNRNSCNKSDIFKHLVRLGRDEVIKAQSERIANRLDAMGIPSRRKQEGGAFFKFGLLTGCVKELDQQYRHIMFIPSVAVAERRSLANELSYWIENILPKSGKYLRYGVVTCGENLRIYDDLRTEHRKWSRKISDTFRKLSDKYGCRLYFRGTEFTFNEDMETLNLHMNVLYDLPLLERDEWCDFLSEMRESLGCRWDDAGCLKNPFEVTKYITKPNDIEQMTNDQLEWFYNETFKTRMIQRYNSFKDFKAGLNENHLRIVLDQSDNSLKTMRKRVINDSELFTKKDKDQSISLPKCVDLFGADLAAAFCIQPALDGRVIRDDSGYDYEADENKIVGLMLPHASFFNLSEPCLMIRNYTDKPQSELGHKALELIKEISKRHYRDVIEKVQELNVDAVTARAFAVLRDSYDMGNRNIEDVELSPQGYSLDNYTITHIGKKSVSMNSVDLGNADILSWVPPPDFEYDDHTIRENQEASQIPEPA